MIQGRGRIQRDRNVTAHGRRDRYSGSASIALAVRLADFVREVFGQNRDRGRASISVKSCRLEMRSNFFHEPAHLFFHHHRRFQTITEIENHLAYPRRFDFS